MLRCLRIRDFAIIDRLEVELGPGLNVVTGETGAGKSILVDALELVLGARGKPEVIRTGSEHAEVEALFELSGDHARELVARLEAGGIEVEGEDELVIRRVISAGGRTRAYVNGRLTTATQLAEIARGLVDISSQHEHHTLADARTHLEVLDAFGKLDAIRIEVARAHETLASAAREIAALEERVRDRAQREDLLRFQIGEIDELGLTPGEEETGKQDRERLRHASRLTEAATKAEEALYSRDGSTSEELGRVASEIREAARLDPALAEHATVLDSARGQIEDVARELGRYARGVTGDPERLAELEDRLDRIGKLKRKYGASVEDILAHRAKAAAELEGLERHEELVKSAEKTRAAALARASEAAQTLSTKRRSVAKKLAQAVTKELSSLGMGEASVVVEVARLEGQPGELQVDGARLTTTGIDRVELLISPNPGEEARPLRKVASGGELSRAMLAIKRALAGLGPGGLYVFDEVDAGVGGAVAEAIGKKLREVASHHQVICITHLAQIAVFGERHFLVHKEIVGGRTRSAVRALPEKERLEEVARMLGGAKITPKTRAAAAELLEHAR